MRTWRQKQAVNLRRRELRERAVAYLGGKCAICGYDQCTAAFDFHHIEVWMKDFTISAHMSSWDRIEPELKKCVLLCSRCHREVHDGLHPGYIAYEDSNRGGDEWQLEMFEEAEA